MGSMSLYMVSRDSLLLDRYGGVGVFADDGVFFAF